MKTSSHDCLLLGYSKTCSNVNGWPLFLISDVSWNWVKKELFSVIINNYKCIWLQSPDGHYIACGAIDGIINIFDLTTGKLLHTLEGEKSKIYPRKNYLQAKMITWTNEFIWHVIIRIHWSMNFLVLCRSRHAYQIINILTWLPAVDYCFWWQSHQDIWCVPFRALTLL